MEYFSVRNGFSKENSNSLRMTTSISDFKYLYDSTAASGFFTFFFLCGGVGARLP